MPARMQRRSEVLRKLRYAPCEELRELRHDALSHCKILLPVRTAGCNADVSFWPFFISWELYPKAPC
jgi:hypothetical protein